MKINKVFTFSVMSGWVGISFKDKSKNAIGPALLNKYSKFNGSRKETIKFEILEISDPIDLNFDPMTRNAK